MLWHIEIICFMKFLLSFNIQSNPLHRNPDEHPLFTHVMRFDSQSIMKPLVLNMFRLRSLRNCGMKRIFPAFQARHLK